MDSYEAMMAGTVGFPPTARAEPIRPSTTVPWRAVAVRTPSGSTAAPKRGSAPPWARMGQASPTPPLDTYVLPTRFLESVWMRQSVRNGVKLRSPLLRLDVSDEDRDGVFVVADSFSTVYGAGDDPDAAINEYLENLFAHFDELDRNELALAPALRQELAAMRVHLSRVP